MRERLFYSLRHPAVKSGVVAVGVAAAVLVFALAFRWPAQRAHQTLEASLSEARHALVTARQAETMAALHAGHLQTVPQLEAKLAAAGDQTRVVNALGELARRHGLRIQNQSYAERRDGAGLAIDLVVEGSYASARNFLHGVAALPVWIEVHEVHLDRGSDAGSVKGRFRLVSVRARTGASR